MNSARRKQIVEALEFLEKAQDIFETCGEEELEYANNMPENMQQGDKFETAEACGVRLDDAAEELEAIKSDLLGYVGDL